MISSGSISYVLNLPSSSARKSSIRLTETCACRIMTTYSVRFARPEEKAKAPTHKRWYDIQGHTQHRKQRDGSERHRDSKILLRDENEAIEISYLLRVEHDIAYQKNEIKVTNSGARAHNIEK